MGKGKRARCWLTLPEVILKWKINLVFVFCRCSILKFECVSVYYESSVENIRERNGMREVLRVRCLEG